MTTQQQGIDIRAAYAALRAAMIADGAVKDEAEFDEKFEKSPATVQGNILHAACQRIHDERKAQQRAARAQLRKKR